MSYTHHSSTAPVVFSQRWHYAKEQAISFLMQQGVENPQVISLAAGLVDYSTLPVHETRSAAEQLLGDPAAAQLALQYGTTAGAERLRHLLLHHFAELEGTSVSDCPATAGRLLVTTGSQQMLSLVCEVLLDPGDICLVAGPTYFVFCGNLSGVGAETVTIPTDDDGMRTDMLEQALQQLDSEGKLARVKLIYVVSYYDNPAGLSLSAERRQDVVEIARRWSREHRILVLEDAAYRELRYDGPVYPSVWSCDDTGGQHVIYTQTFSKTFAPGLRVGYGIVPDDLVRPLCDRKGNEDFGSANLNQHLLAGVLQSGQYAEHLGQVCEAYRQKRDAMLSAAEEHFSKIPGASWVHPHGGLYVWLTLPERIETGFDSPLFTEAVKRQEVMYVPGELCYTGPVDQRPRHQMRLSYGVQTPSGIHEGIQRLAKAISNCL
ncbi:MAG: PLP-dependent aminotransferase family protein [Planctomycetaceae bacterium]